MIDLHESVLDMFLDAQQTTIDDVRAAFCSRLAGYAQHEREMLAQWRRKNRAKINAYAREYTATHRDEVNARKRSWYARNAERLKQYHREHYAKNRAKICARQNAQRAAARATRAAA